MINYRNKREKVWQLQHYICIENDLCHAKIVPIITRNKMGLFWEE
jgi:hypothetical protein